MSDPLVDHRVLSRRYFYPEPNHFDGPFFVEGDGFRLGCRFCLVDDAAPTEVSDFCWIK